MSRRYGVTDADIASRWGYHLTPDDGVTDRSEPGNPVTAGEMLVWTGYADGRPQAEEQDPAMYNGMRVPEGGCAGEASRSLEFTSREDVAEPLVVSIDFGAFRQATDDGRVRAVFGEWSECMRAKGYDYPDPIAAGGAADVTTAEPSTAEVRTATADVACKAQHNVIGVWFAVESAYETAMINTKLEELHAAQAKMAIILRNAQAALAARD